MIIVVVVFLLIINCSPLLSIYLSRIKRPIPTIVHIINQSHNFSLAIHVGLEQSVNIQTWSTHKKQINSELYAKLKRNRSCCIHIHTHSHTIDVACFHGVWYVSICELNRCDFGWSKKNTLYPHQNISKYQCFYLLPKWA